VLDAEEKDRHKDLRDYDKGHRVMSCGLLEALVPTKGNAPNWMQESFQRATCLNVKISC